MIPQLACCRRLSLICAAGWSFANWSRVWYLRTEVSPRRPRFPIWPTAWLGLLDEMVDEGIDPQDVAGLDVGDVSGHWQKTLQFLDIIARYRDLDASQHFSAAARFREAAETLTSAWRDDPPTDPILIAGSTGSRGHNRNGNARDCTVAAGRGDTAGGLILSCQRRFGRS